ncbi:MAG TPA: bis(5'-nucleosyl)-tetraphosphatase (symmetrical) YqeK [Candidatus Eremiobacteraceae bacterium]|nr:bis(5'-nucleosyl)-tetraphosphatase (symmetrical) YqeK [Candidatus Eremiobacteraceae bacterium]
MTGVEFLRLCREARVRTGAGRFRHCVSVARTADKLAARYGASSCKARVAGMLHDVARGWSGEQLLAYAQAHGIAAGDAERAAPVLLHAPIGADIARREFGVEDAETLGAIRRHTIAGPRMTTLEKILYVADTIEPTRTYPGREALEAAAAESLDRALLACVKESMQYLTSRGISIAPETAELYDELVKHDGRQA